MISSRSAIQELLGSRAAGSLFRPLVRGRATILMLHRFSVPELGVEGHDPAELRRILAALRRERIRIADLHELFEEMSAGRVWKERVVAFTIDDGYHDQATVGADAFAAYDCPVTTFVTSGFLDRELWFWWDRIAYVFAQSRHKSISLSLGDQPLRYEWSDRASRDRAQADFTNRCKHVPELVKLAAIEALAVAAEVDVPRAAPNAYAPMSWDDLRRCETRGMRFGPHTVTHPVLANTSDEQSRWELTESWRRLRDEARHPTPVFCYPNGQLSDFTDREMETLRSIGVCGGVIGVVGYAAGAEFRATRRSPYLVPRFAYEQSVPAMMQIINGIERAKQLVKGQR
jgi:peptidoglycan/xylan/chitin deacetylase (PgdA/CDA1 family)